MRSNCLPLDMAFTVNFVSVLTHVTEQKLVFVTYTVRDSLRSRFKLSLLAQIN